MRIFLLSVFLFFSIVLLWFSLGGFFYDEFLEIKKNLPEIADLIQTQGVDNIPLVVIEREGIEGKLIQAEIIKWTNYQRTKNGLPTLKENSKLNLTAQKKIEDMFNYQYFAHESLQGEEVADLARKNNYQFLVIGENLAMGNFVNDESLVEAWMNSPGHRENILSKNYHEIGVAAKKGLFDGKSIWLAVQHFGLPESACPKPDEEKKLLIEENQDKLKIMENLLIKLKAEIDNKKTVKDSIYQEYNDLVEKYNQLLTEVELSIEQYNNQVNFFNQCLIKQ